MTLRHLLNLLIIICCIGTTVAADTIVRKDGTTVVGKIATRNADAIWLRLADSGVIIKIDLANIKSHVPEDVPRPEEKPAETPTPADTQSADGIPILECSVVKGSIKFDGGSMSLGPDRVTLTKERYPLVVLELKNVSSKRIDFMEIAGGGDPIYVKGLSPGITARCKLRGRPLVVKAVADSREAALDKLKNQAAGLDATKLVKPQIHIRFSGSESDKLTALRPVEQGRVFSLPEKARTKPAPSEDQIYAAAAYRRVIDMEAVAAAAQKEQDFNQNIQRLETEGRGPLAVAGQVADALVATKVVLGAKFTGVFYEPLQMEPIGVLVTEEEERVHAKLMVDGATGDVARGSTQHKVIPFTDLVPKTGSSPTDAPYLGLVYRFTYVANSGLERMNETGRIILKYVGTDGGYRPYASCVDGVTRVVY